MKSWKAERRAAGDLPEIPDDVVLPTVLGPARRFADLWLRGRTATPVEEAGKTLAGLAWSGLASTVAGQPGWSCDILHVASIL